MDKPTFIHHPEIEGLIEVHLGYHTDSRGINFEGLNPELYPAEFNDFLAKTPVDSFSLSKSGVLRGFHGDIENDKLIQVLSGIVQFVVYDARANSPTSQKYKEFLIGSEFPYNARPRQFLIPKGVLNAHACLSAHAVFSYKFSKGYVHPESQLQHLWSSYRGWLIANPILSERDS